MLVAEDIARHLGLKYNLLALYKTLTALYFEKGDHYTALVYCKAYVDLNDSITSINIAKNISQLEVKYHTTEKDKDIAQKQLLITQQEQRLQKKMRLLPALLQ